MSATLLTVDQQLAIAHQLLPDLAPLIEAHVVPRLGGQAAATPTLPELCATMDLCHLSDASRRDWAYIYRRLLCTCPEVASIPVDALTPAILADALRATWPTSAYGYNKALSIIKTTINYAIRKRLCRLVTNPVNALDKRRTTEQEILALPVRDLRAILRCCEVRPNYRCLIPYVAIMAWAGIRPTEAARLTWGDIDMAEGVVEVRACNSKTGGTRHVEMHPTLRAWLTTWRPEGTTAATPIPPIGWLPSRMCKMRRNAGLSSAWQPDCMRHSYATYYLKARLGSLEQLQANMGHTTLHLLRTRYLNMRGVTAASAAAWWSLQPCGLYAA